MSEVKLSQFGTITARRKDYITYLAVALLSLIIVGEIVFAIWLPSKLNSEKAWEKEALMEDNIERLDILRGGLSSVKSRNSGLGGEIQLVQKCLDEYAKYLRANKLHTTLEQAVEINKMLISFHNNFVNWKIGKSYVAKEKLDSSALLRKMLEDFNKSQQ